ncbi:uncharacterized protein [Neodiprion pinetum]|uniref:Uncharacterized protein LOC107226512 n=1 Tax=Neodiprion lecontei TaxID=441921 RepID=A0A6J0C8W0_NEOLC|nr:uncharacterized protein LOC107226512 [Neodiprion lecontei]XP_046427416.1 uncharacterized protein LOC124183237 [Neodiprion fabricii]XP_046484507.1 uncharacterized protein LOC124220101 [Neodiprion pinetum]XP_046622563.1 uncharacterized protein LOC124306211 [Neodiprion virginianus]
MNIKNCRMLPSSGREKTERFLSEKIGRIEERKNTAEKMRDEVKMDANRLIAEVYKRPALWNQRHISYHNREVTNRVWMEIATIFKLPQPVLKAKWKGLRDTFRAELKKEQVYRKSKYHRNRPVWIHYKNLQFLKEQMLPRPPIWERNRRENVEETDTSENENLLQEDTQEALSEHVMSIDGNDSGKVDSVNQVEVKQEPEENFENLEFQSVSENFADNEMMLQNISPEQVLMGGSDSNISLTVDPLEASRCDDNYYFLMSLLPHIRTLPAEKRMWLRIQMQELVYKEVYKKSNADGAEVTKSS